MIKNNRKRKNDVTVDAFQVKKKSEIASDISDEDFLKTICSSRLTCASSVKSFKFHKKRVRILSSTTDICETSNGILYWMSRDERVQDNWALLYAQHLALKIECPLLVCFCLVPKLLDATMRHYWFLLKGLQEVEKECKALNISFHLLLGDAPTVLPKFVSKYRIGGVVTDFSPLRFSLQQVENVKLRLPPTVPFCQVDAHNIVPCWIASDKKEYAARTIRPKILKHLAEFFTEFPQVIKHPYSLKQKSEAINWKAAESVLEVDKSVKIINWAKPGTVAGLCMLNEFCVKRLKYFSIYRNDPSKDGLSKLSPWLHFGQISAQRCALMVRRYKSKYANDVEMYFEEAVIRKELADNFCFYNPKYDSIEGASDWAKKTLADHAKDKREYVYTREEFEHSLTHDPLWNAAQNQMVQEGKMHGFLRMYWAKKILEWTNSPREALEFAIYLNDKYELDGRDPSGYVGCAWSICGIHDTAWSERPVFGKIRYMNFQGCKRKFDVDSFIEKYK